MIHHASLGVSNIERASAFYDAVLAPLGYVRIWEDLRPGEPNQAIGYGPEGSDDKLAIKFKPKGQRSLGHGFHLAFEAPNRNAVASFQRWPHSFGQFSEIFKWNIRGDHAADLMAGSVAKYASSGVRSA
uniref:VOC family protein n=6 Tax=Burkholderia gladioli TaxID=28095 RepID=UPI00163E1645